MKKLFVVFAVLSGFVALSLATQSHVLAADVAEGFGICDGIAKETNTCKDVAAQEGVGTNPVINTLKIALNILSFIAGVAAVILLIINGLRLVLSNGDANGVKNARSGVIYVLIGVLVVVIAQSIVIFVLDRI